MSPVHLRNLGIPRNQPEDRQGLFATTRPGCRHHGHHNRWQDTEGNHTHAAIHPPIQLENQTRVLEGYLSSSPAPSTPQIFIPMENGQQEVQPRSTLGKSWSKLLEDMSQRVNLKRSYGSHQRMEYQQELQTPGGEDNQDKGISSHYPSHRRVSEPDRAYSDFFRHTRSQPTRIPSSFTPFRKQQISDQESPFFTMPRCFQVKTRIQRGKLDSFQPQAEIFRPNDPESYGLGERSTQETEIAVNPSTISSPINRNITPNQNEHNVVTPESSLNSD
ncbi:hypothetical protein O181_020126 [Austropuccinia psidii MF-1]|uniref:Uncharacterized protein n=1 Tax=Austropuccinia psidii MF-1 TaxID=1389203 RepID=A0A9Q3CCW4_9BASI|nr:hypothetical protein [Austropuccinia psidii MF-1]